MPLRPKKSTGNMRRHVAIVLFNQAHRQHPDHSLMAGYDLGPEFDEVWDSVAGLASKGPAYLRALARAIEAHGGADSSGLERKALGVLAGDAVTAQGQEFGRSNLDALGLPPPAEFRQFHLGADDVLTEVRS